jgi:hypothetical protein
VVDVEDDVAPELLDDTEGATASAGSNELSNVLTTAKISRRTRRIAAAMLEHVSKFSTHELKQYSTEGADGGSNPRPPDYRSRRRVDPAVGDRPRRHEPSK